MFYGVCGAHRTGKTTLAQGVADKMDVPFWKTNLAEVLQAIGVKASADMTFDKRLQLQEMIVECLGSSYAAAAAANPTAEVIIVDRTPLDVLGYTVSEVLRETMTPELIVRMAHHEKLCYEMTNMMFMGITFVQPAIPIVFDATKGTCNTYYQRHVSNCIFGAVATSKLKAPLHVLPLKTLQIKARVSDTVSEVLATMNSRSRHTESFDQAIARPTMN